MTKILSAARARNLDVETFADAPGAGGWSALGMAVRVNNTGVVDALLAYGARGDALMGNGKTPLEIARVNERVAIVDAIEKTLLDELNFQLKATYVGVGDPVDEIIRAGKDYSAIVLGGSTKSTLQRMITSSIPLNLVRKAPNSVMIIR